jgi:hypothetical protein
VVNDNHFIFFDENNPFIKKLNLEESEALEGDLKPEKKLVALKNMKNGNVSFPSYRNIYCFSPLPHSILLSFS